VIGIGGRGGGIEFKLLRARAGGLVIIVFDEFGKIFGSERY